jgi:hypothetical protein
MRGKHNNNVVATTTCSYESLRVPVMLEGNLSMAVWLNLLSICLSLRSYGYDRLYIFSLLTVHSYYDYQCIISIVHSYERYTTLSLTTWWVAYSVAFACNGGDNISANKHLVDKFESSF